MKKNKYMIRIFTWRKLDTLLENQLLIIKNQVKIMSALDDLKAALANEDIALAALLTAYNALVAKLNTLPVDDSAALAALTQDVNTQAAAINAALNLPAVAPTPGS